jgi:hypothetical protein
MSGGRMAEPERKESRCIACDIVLGAEWFLVLFVVWKTGKIMAWW